LITRGLGYLHQERLNLLLQLLFIFFQTLDLLFQLIPLAGAFTDIVVMLISHVHELIKSLLGQCILLNKEFPIILSL